MLLSHLLLSSLGPYVRAVHHVNNSGCVTQLYLYINTLYVSYILLEASAFAGLSGGRIFFPEEFRPSHYLVW